MQIKLTHHHPTNRISHPHPTHHRRLITTSTKAAVVVFWVPTSGHSSIYATATSNTSISNLHINAGISSRRDHILSNQLRPQVHKHPPQNHPTSSSIHTRFRHPATQAIIGIPPHHFWCIRRRKPRHLTGRTNIPKPFDHRPHRRPPRHGLHDPAQPVIPVRGFPHPSHHW